MENKSIFLILIQLEIILKIKKRDTTVLGSQGYAAPEQFGFYQTDIRSDIYSLGVLYHVLLTNKLPRDYDLQGIEKRIIDKMIAIDPQADIKM